MSLRRISVHSKHSTALRARIREDLEHEARHARQNARFRSALMKQLAARVPFDVPPSSLVDRELDRRLEDFARRLLDQNVNPARGQHRLAPASESPAGRGARSGSGGRRDR